MSLESTTIYVGILGNVYLAGISYEYDKHFYLLLLLSRVASAHTAGCINMHQLRALLLYKRTLVYYLLRVRASNTYE